MATMTRAKATCSMVLAIAVGAAGPSAVLADAAYAKAKPRHCVKFKTVKTKKGKKVQRCAKYGK